MTIVVDGPRKPQPLPWGDCPSNTPHCTKGEIKYCHLMNKHNTKKRLPQHQLRPFDLGFISGVVNKARSQRGTVSAAGVLPQLQDMFCYGSCQVIDLWHARDKVLAQEQITTRFSNQSLRDDTHFNLKPSTMCQLKLLIRGNLAVSMMSYANSWSTYMQLWEVGDNLSTKVLSIMAYSEPFLRRNAALLQVGPPQSFRNQRRERGMRPLVTFKEVEPDEYTMVGRSD